jgi:predicted glycosyltransferase
MLPRNDVQRTLYQTGAETNLIVPENPLDGANLIAHSDLVVSAGGTMNREAAALGIPAASIYLGEWAALDKQLVDEGRLRRISTAKQIAELPVKKKREPKARLALQVAGEVASLILEP